MWWKHAAAAALGSLPLTSLSRSLRHSAALGSTRRDNSRGAVEPWALCVGLFRLKTSPTNYARPRSFRLPWLSPRPFHQTRLRVQEAFSEGVSPSPFVRCCQHCHRKPRDRHPAVIAIKQRHLLFRCSLGRLSNILMSDEPQNTDKKCEYDFFFFFLWE